MKMFSILNIIAFIVLAIGGINWGLIAIFNWNLVGVIFSGWTIGSIIVYILVAVATLWLIFAAFYGKGKIDFREEK